MPVGLCFRNLELKGTFAASVDPGLCRGIEFIRLCALDFANLLLMKSMTGYGRGECSKDGFKITVELSSVNRKQTEISVALPREMEMLEAQARDLINRHIARGRLTVRVSLHAGAGKSSARMHLNAPLAKAYARELNRLAKQLKLPGPVTLDQLARAPGVLQTDEELAVEEDFWPAVEKALKKAGITIGNVDLIEIQEAFAVQCLADARMSGISDQDMDAKVNVNGSGISLGHPIGATGAMRLVTLLHEMRRRGVRWGLETICGGGGQGICLIIERC